MRNIIKLTAMIIFAAVLCFFSLFLTDWLYNPKGFNLFKYLFRDFLLIIAMFVSWKAVLLLVPSLKNEIIKNLVGVTVVFFSLILLLEIFFSFVLLSGGGEKTLVGKNWFNYYWKINELGYRDNSPKEIDRADKKNIFIIGDSYVAGHGLKKESQRFSNILRSELKDCADVFNLGVCGADTKEEFGFLASFPVKPDLVILSYVNNDIYKILDKEDIYKILKTNPKKDNNLRKFIRTPGFLSAHSFFLNFLDFILFVRNRDQTFKTLVNKYSSPENLFESEDGKALELTYYINDSLMKLQLSNLDKFIQYSDSNNIDLLVVLFPLSDDRVIDYTNKTANEPIAEYIENKGISVINFTSSLKTIPEEDRHVNKFDPHPGIFTNKVIADTLKKRIMSEGFLEKNCN